MVVIYEGSRMMNKVRWRSQARDGHATRDRRNVQALTPSVWPWPFPRQSHVAILVARVRMEKQITMVTFAPLTVPLGVIAIAEGSPPWHWDESFDGQISVFPAPVNVVPVCVKFV